MKIKDGNINIEDAISFASYQDLLLKRRSNNLLLSDFQIDILNSNGVNYQKYSNLHDLLFDINSMLQDNYVEELDIVASQLSEMLYYSETKKWELIELVKKMWITFLCVHFYLTTSIKNTLYKQSLIQ